MNTIFLFIPSSQPPSHSTTSLPYHAQYPGVGRQRRSAYSHPVGDQSGCQKPESVVQPRHHTVRDQEESGPPGQQRTTAADLAHKEIIEPVRELFHIFSDGELPDDIVQIHPAVRHATISTHQPPATNQIKKRRILPTA